MKLVEVTFNDLEVMNYSGLVQSLLTKSRLNESAATSLYIKAASHRFLIKLRPTIYGRHHNI